MTTISDDGRVRGGRSSLARAIGPAGLAPNPGADTDGPAKIPLTAWWRVAARAWRNGRKDNLNVLAGGIAFYAFLALLPFVASIATIYGLFARERRVVADIGTALSILPEGSAGLLAGRVARVIADDSVGMLGLGFALLLAIYGAARGARSIVSGLNVMYGRRRRSQFVQRWAVALVIALAGAGLLLLALLGIAFHAQVRHLLPAAARPAYDFVRVLYWAVMSIGVSTAIAVLYRYGPAGRHQPWRRLLPGALTATLTWLTASVAFGAYVATFERYERIYGPFAAVVVLQLWLYLSAFAVLFGAKLNAEADRQAKVWARRVGRVRRRVLG